MKFSIILSICVSGIKSHDWLAGYNVYYLRLRNDAILYLWLKIDIIVKIYYTMNLMIYV